MTCDRGITIDYRLYHFRIVIPLKKNSVIISIVWQISTIKKIEQIVKKNIKKEWP